MVSRLMVAVAWALICGSSQPASAGDFDGTKALMCTCGDGLEYHRNGGQKPFNPESAGLPKTFVVDFKSKLIRPTRDSVVRRRSKIKRTERIEEKLVLQGAEDGVEGVDDGVGWSMAIEQGAGGFVITASGSHVGYIVFGSCLIHLPSE